MTKAEASDVVTSEVKYLLLPIVVDGKTEGMSVPEAEGVVKGYLARGFAIIATTITGIGPSGMTVAHVLVK